MTNIHIFEDSTCLKMVYCNTGILALENEQVCVQYYDDIQTIFFHFLHDKKDTD